MITIGFTHFSYFEVIDLANETAEEAQSYETRTLNFVIELLGDKGIILVGATISAYLIHQIKFDSFHPITKQLKVNSYA